MASYLTASHWLVAVPNELGSNKPIEKFRTAMVEKFGRSLADMSVFDVPMLKVGTLDSLMALSDDLSRVDGFIETVLKKVERQVAESYNALKTQEILAKRRSDDDGPIVVPALGLRCAGKPVNEYIAKFKWDSNTWDPREPLPDLVKRMSTAAERIDADMRQYATAYQEKKTALQGAERKRSGNLMVAALEDIITPTSLQKADCDWIAGDSESSFISSLVLVLPKTGEEAFLAEYSRYAADAVPVGPEGKREAEKTGPAVPGTARKIAEDKDGYVLYIVVALKKYADNLKNACKERRITVRDFDYQPNLAGSGARVAEQLSREANGALNLLKDVSRARYEESMSLWMHVKAVRTFVDAVLRYGLPVNFTTVLLKVVREGSNAGATGKRLLDSVAAAWTYMAKGSRLLDESVATAAAGDAEDDGKADPVIAGVTDAPGQGLPFVLVDFEIRADTAATNQK